jgi:hypothetical protein
MAKAPKNLNWGAFNPGNLKGDYLGQLRDDVYGGYKQTSSTERVRTGKDSYGNKTTNSLNTDYYRQHGGWSSVADHIGIKSINSNNDIRAMYDYVSGYKPPAPAAPTPTAAPVPKAPSISFNQEVAQINSQYQAENKRLTDLISSQTRAYNDQAAAFDKRFGEQQSAFDKSLGDQQDRFDSSINNLNNRVANASNAYDPTKNMGSSNNINPALSIQEKNKSLSSGTQRYNRNSGLNIKNVNL